MLGRSVVDDGRVVVEAHHRQSAARSLCAKRRQLASKSRLLRTAGALYGRAYVLVQVRRLPYPADRPYDLTPCGSVRNGLRMRTDPGYPAMRLGIGVRVLAASDRNP